MNKINAKSRNKRPECGANAPTFLSAVYKSGTQAKKRQAGAPQYGRSMIEMLGVLAIIGVLSVGGIMGYSKAMMRYKINKTIEQITYIAGNVRTTFASQGNYDGLSGNTTIWKKSHIFPEDMWKDGEDTPQNVWDGNVNIYTENKNSTDTQGKAFFVEYYKIPEEACIELITQNWRDAQVKMIRVYNDENMYFGSDDYFFEPPADIDTAVKFCSNYSHDDIIELQFYFDIDTSESFWKYYIDNTASTLSGI